MANDLKAITLRLRHWLNKNNIETEGVHLTIEFPNYRTACEAEMAIKREIEPLQAYSVGGAFGRIETMNGIGLTLKHR